LPSFLIHEPRDAVETAGGLMALGAIAGFLVVASGAIRGIGAFLRTRSAVRTWLEGARAIGVSGWPGRAYLVEAPFTGACAVGLLRPRLLIGRSTLEVCTPAELAAIVAHEQAHVMRRDNARRLILHCLGDLVSATRVGPAIERAWIARAEEEADLETLRGQTTSGVDLASALIKVARMRLLPLEHRLAMSSFGASGPIERRIRALLGEGPRAPRRRGREWRCFWLVMLPLVVATWVRPELSSRLHQVTESIVRLLASH
jgi:hypothetical protein